MSRFAHYKTGVKHSLRAQRLSSAIQSYTGELEGLEKRVPPHCINSFDTARKLLLQAEEQARLGFIDRGWRLFQAARRMELLSFCHDQQRQSNARHMLKEVEKIPGWRNDAIKQLLGDGKKIPGVWELYQAALIRDEHYANNAYKGAMLRVQAIALAFVLLLVLTMLFIWLGWYEGALPPLEAFDTTPFQALITIGLFGVLGGTVSALTSVSRNLDAARIPELTTTFQVTLLRLSMGFSSAVVVFLLLQSELAENVLTGLFSEGLAESLNNAQPYTSYFIAFCAGFSERLVSRAVEIVAGK